MQLNVWVILLSFLLNKFQFLKKVDVEDHWHLPKVTDLLNYINVKHSDFSYYKFKNVEIHKPTEKYTSKEYMPDFLEEQAIAMFFS